MWYKLPVSDRMSLMKTYRKGGFSYNDMVKDYNNSYEKFSGGGEKKPTFNEFYKTVNPDFNDTTIYNLREAYNELPYKTTEAWRVNPEQNHLPDTYKLPNHETFSDESKYYKPGMRAVHWKTNQIYNSPKINQYQDGGTSDDSSFLEKTLNVLDYPQKQMMKQLTGKEQYPSEYLKEKGYNNKWVGLAADIVADPMNFLPIAKLKYLKGLSGVKDLDKINTIKKQYNTAVKTSSYIDNGQDALKVVYEPAKAAVKPKIAEPYLLRSTRKMTKEEEIMDSFLSHETSNKNKLKRTTNYSNPNLQNKK